MEIQQKDGVTVISTDERLDALAAPKLKEAVKKMSEESASQVGYRLGQDKIH